MAKNGDFAKFLNCSLSAAKQDEFYTHYVNIQKQVEADLEYDANEIKTGTFRDKVVYDNCDDAADVTDVEPLDVEYYLTSIGRNC